jgi:hypothetical protein
VEANQTSEGRTRARIQEALGGAREKPPPARAENPRPEKPAGKYARRKKPEGVTGSGAPSHHR